MSQIKKQKYIIKRSNGKAEYQVNAVETSLFKKDRLIYLVVACLN